MNCTRCEGTGFLNTHQVPDNVLAEFDKTGDYEVVKRWIAENPDTDTCVCDCCGDGDAWYGVPGEHYGPDDQPGPQGPYASNGGPCKCH